MSQLVILPPAVEPELTDDRPSFIREITRSALDDDAAARQLIDALVEAQVDHFFGVPGGPAAPLFEAIRLNVHARLVESRHETAAAFAAAGYFHATGRVAAIVLTAGPGITNAVTGIASAHLERVPLLVLAGDVAWAARGTRLAQDSGPEGIAAEALLHNYCRATIRAANGPSAATQALAALQAATNPLRPGPALLVVPMDRATAVATPVVTQLCRIEQRMPAPDAQVRLAGEWLSGARRPLLVVGGGCRIHASAIQQLVDQLRLPFVTTPRAKGVISENHPLSLRNGGMSASRWARRYTSEAIDVTLALGTDLDDTSMGPTRYSGPDGRLIHVDVDPTVFRRNLPTALPIHADLSTFAEQLTLAAVIHQWVNANGRALVRSVQEESPFDIADFQEDEHTPVAPHRVIADLEAAVGPDARFVSDIGEHMLFCLHYLTATRPDSFHIQLNLGSMGSGIGSAIGLALASPTRRVVCICGDGGMQMSSMDVLVAAREHLPILYVVFNDARYNMVHHGMKQLYGSADPWCMPQVDFEGWGRAAGLPSHTISKPGEITAELIDDLMAGGGPALLDVRIDREIRIRGGGRVEALQQMSMLEVVSGR